MVVVLDPSADPDDILRANRSREKHYIFDHAFDQMAKQVHILFINNYYVSDIFYCMHVRVE